MKQADLIAKIAEVSGHTKKDVDHILKIAGDVAHEALQGGDDITLPGIGKLSVKERAARIGRNPSTGAELKIAAKKVPVFTAAKALKDAVAK